MRISSKISFIKTLLTQHLLPFSIPACFQTVPVYYTIDDTNNPKIYQATQLRGDQKVYLLLYYCMNSWRDEEMKVLAKMFWFGFKSKILLILNPRFLLYIFYMVLFYFHSALLKTSENNQHPGTQMQALELHSIKEGQGDQVLTSTTCNVSCYTP